MQKRAMNPRTILRTLGSVAHDDDKRDVLHSLEVIRSELAHDTTDALDERMSESEFRSIKADAVHLLHVASSMAHARKGKRAILRVAAAWMGQMPPDESPNLECSFVVRAVWRKRHGRADLELVGPVDASPRFLIAYAFWVVAKALPEFAWSKLRRTRCASCKKWFMNDRRGRPRIYCSPTCYETGHAMKDQRRRKK